VLSDKDFESLVPWYVNGTLDDGDRALVAAYLEAHPEQKTRLSWNESLRSAIKDQAGALPADIGLQRALLAVREAEGTRALPRAGAPGQITQLLESVRGGDTGARDALFALAYGELKKLAHARLYQAGRSNTLDTIGLVHEAYLRFIRSTDLRSEDRRSFFAFASQVMRNVIVDTARARLAQRRGGGVPELTLSTQLLEKVSSGEEAILDVHEALLVLEQADPRLAQVVEMRYYGGYTEAEIAETLGVTERTVQRDWTKARLLLHAALHRKG
jgi:RNA polymerase sigma factor (TIGR02999 family)